MTTADGDSTAVRPVEEGARGAGKGDILVIDDCPTVRRRVQEILEGDDYDVRLAADGRLGLEEVQRARPDMILVDFVMPGMNGYQFCQAIREIEEVRSVPVILVSLKADRIGEQFIRLGLADDVLSKPFQPAALRAVVEHRLGVPSLRTEREEEPDQEEAAAPEPASDPEEQARERAARAVEKSREILIEQLLPALDRAVAPDDHARDAMYRALLEALDETALRSVLPALADLDPHAGVPSFSGTLDALPIGEVFQMISLQNLTGAMEIERTGFRARIYFSRGHVDLSRLEGGGEMFRLGRYLVQDDLVSAREIERLAEARGDASEPIGERLIKLGLIGREDLQDALKRQAADIFYDVLRWNHGVFRFRPNVRVDEAERAALAIPVSGLLMEGYRRVDEWRLVEREIRDFGDVFDPRPAAIESLDAGELSTDEKLVLDHVNGSNPVSEIIRLTRLGSFEACRILYRLASLRLIQRSREPAAEDPDSA